MKEFLRPNLNPLGRCARGLGALLCFVGAYLTRDHSLWLPLVLAFAGVFCTFQAVHGWCLMRACKINMPF